MKRLLSVFLSVIMLVSTVASVDLTSLADEISDAIDNNISWFYDDETYLLTVWGTGDMPDWTANSSAPWSEYKSSVRKILIEDGITSVGSYAFSNFTSLTDVMMPDSVERISRIGHNAQSCHHYRRGCVLRLLCIG